MIIPIELRFKADKDSKSAFRTDKTIKSHDINTVEFHISIDGLELTDNHTAKILSIFHSSKSQANVDCEIVDGKIIYKPDTKLISRYEHVTSYVYVYHNNQSLDVCEFTYIVDLSKIDETSLEVKEVYDQSYADLLADFEQALSDYKDNLPQVDSLRAEIDVVLNQFSEDSQAKLSLINEAEESRIEAEGQRESAEANRVSAESSRVSAESERVLAENERENAEAQRKIDHANRSAELAGKADKVVLENMIENGDFSDGLVGWNKVGNPTNFNVVDSELRIIGSPAQATGIMQDLKGSTTDKFYIRIHKYENLDDILIRVFNYGTYTEPGTLYFGETSSHIVSKKDGIRLYIQTLSTVPETTNATIDEVCIINLTETFGAGNEPTKEEMDELIDVTGYINGKYALNNEAMLSYLMRAVHDRANKKQEDWLYPTITNGTADTTSPPKFFKDEFGVVHLSGRISDLVGNRQTLFTLPTGYRPNVSEGYPVVTGGGTFGFASINSVGVLSLTTGSTIYILLDGITFRAER